MGRFRYTEDPGFQVFSLLMIKRKSTFTHQRIWVLFGVFLFTSVIAGCGSGETSFCDSAQEFQNSIERADLSDITAALGPEFWSDLQGSLNDLEDQTNGEFNESVQELQSRLNSLVSQLESADYDLGKIFLSPETLSNFTVVTSTLVEFVANQLQDEISTTCAK